jgi:hypothetical protein
VIGFLGPNETVTKEVARTETLTANPAVCPAHVSHQDVSAGRVHGRSLLERAAQILAICPRHVVSDVIAWLTVLAAHTCENAELIQQRL